MEGKSRLHAGCNPTGVISPYLAMPNRRTFSAGLASLFKTRAHDVTHPYGNKCPRILTHSADRALDRILSRGRFRSRDR